MPDGGPKKITSRGRVTDHVALSVTDAEHQNHGGSVHDWLRRRAFRNRCSAAFQWSRLSAGLSLKDVSRELGLSRPCLVKFENAEEDANIPIAVLYRAAELFNVPIDRLFPPVDEWHSPLSRQAALFAGYLLKLEPEIELPSIRAAVEQQVLRAQDGDALDGRDQKARSDRDAE